MTRCIDDVSFAPRRCCLHRQLYSLSPSPCPCATRQQLWTCDCHRDAAAQSVTRCYCYSPEEEFYVITWDAKKETIFEMPTGGAALMRSGKNLLKLARKEQCLALLCAPPLLPHPSAPSE